MMVSVVIPVYNEQRHLEKCLDSIFDQTTRPKEIIVIDDGSTDDSVKIVRKYKEVTLIHQSHAGTAVARNLGASKAKGEILVFLDADMIYDKDFIKILVEPIIKRRAGATFTRSEYVANLDNKWAKLWNMATVGTANTRLRGDVGKTGITFRAITKAWFDKAGGFADVGYTDDVSVLDKLNKNSLAVDTVICYHYNPQTVVEVFSSARWMGRDTHNKRKWSRLVVFSPIWSFFKAIKGTIEVKDLSFFLFKIVFDMGYLMGFFDINVWGVHYK